MTRADGTGMRPGPRVLAAAGMVAALAMGTAAPVGAEPWRVIAIGESNDEAQQAELLAFFEAGADDKLATVTVAETLAAMEGIFDLEGVDTAYSSTALTCREPGAGLDVTTRNIEVVSPELYALALVTAGIEDAELAVAAPDDAPALGMTALTGVFATMDGAPCGPTDPDSERQRLALEGLALAAELGQAREDEGGRAGTAEVVLETQRAVVARSLTEAPAIEEVVAGQEAAAGIELAPDERAALVGLMSRLGEARLDWGGFEGGWTTDRDADGSRVAMVGSRAAVAIGVGGAARQDTTPEGTATATATSAATATMRRVSTPEAGLPAASPVATPAASPSASPVALAGSIGQAGPPDETIAGTVVERRDGGGFLVEEADGERRAYADASGEAVVTRSGTVARLADVQPGDAIRMSVDGSTGEIRRLDATPVATEERGVLQRFGWLSVPLLIALAAAVFARRRVGGAVMTGGPRAAGPVRTLVTKPARALMTRRRSWVFGRGRRGAAVEEG